MKRTELIEILNLLDCDDISFNQLKKLFVANNKNYKNFHVYVFYKNSEVLYVGQTTNLRKRFINHYKATEYKEWKDTITKVEVYDLNSYDEMMALESFLIDSLNPLYNEKVHIKSLLKDNNYSSYKLSYSEILKFIDRKDTSYSSILEKLEMELISGADEIVLVDWLRNNFYNKDTIQKTVDNCYTNIKPEIIKLCTEHNYTLISKRGKGNKAYLIKK